jgi:putative aminopeptidase FrvX
VPERYDLLFELLKIDSPSGDEGVMADWIDGWIRRSCPEARLVRLGDSLVAIRGEKPPVSIYAHIDTTGFTLGYERRLIPIGSPSPVDGTAVRQLGAALAGVVRERDDEWYLDHVDAEPGSRWVYAAEPAIDESQVTSPYLDNRAGIYAALNVLRRCPSVAVAFTTGEEHSGQGAVVCARYLYEKLGIDKALISDITWDTDHVHIGKGVAISLRDRMVPRQRFLDRVLDIGDASGIAYQREIESSGGSDGMYLQRSGYPIDWVFVGAPERDPHSDHEVVDLSDLDSMVEMLVTLVENLEQ